MLEVEKKFKVPSNFNHLLMEQGWSFLKEIRFKDTYYDSESYELVQIDHWLRRRDKKWQLKCPMSTENRLDCVRIDKYLELEDDKAIIDHLASVLKADSSNLSGKTVNDVVENVLVLKPLAEFESHRVKYKLNEFAIDLDKTNFDYELGEMEVMCINKDEMEEATAKIFDMAGKLGVNIHDCVTGKVGTYLKMNNKNLYDKLVSKGILVAETL